MARAAEAILVGRDLMARTIEIIQAAIDRLE